MVCHAENRHGVPIRLLTEDGARLLNRAVMPLGIDLYA
jgi:hypothetical protein